MFSWSGRALVSDQVSDSVEESVTVEQDREQKKGLSIRY